MATRETLRRREYQRLRHIERREENNQRSRDWYYEHQEEVLARHKERMQNDPEYAERIRANSRRSYRERMKKKRQQRREEKSPKKSTDT